MELTEIAQNSLTVDSPDMTQLVQRMVRMEQSGMLERVEQMLSLLNAALDVMTPEIIAGLAQTTARFMELADTFLQSGVTRGLPDAFAEMDILLKTLKNPPDPKSGSFRQLMGALRDPDVRVGLAVGLQVVKQFGAGIRKED